MRTDIVLREPQLTEIHDDLRWVIAQHGQIYAREYGWNGEFEVLVAGICADFTKNFQPEFERCWIAEKPSQQGMQRLGSIFIARKDADTAQLRMLILTPQARGLGLGARLADEAMAFARERGYKKITLWTNSCLTAARRIYEKRGFKLISSEPYQGFGKEALVSETWELML